MIMKANKQIGFIYKDNESIDKIFKDGDVVFEKGFLRERTTTTFPLTFGGVGKNLKDYKIYGNTGQTVTTGKNLVDFSSSQGYTYTGGVPSVTTNNIRINSKNSNNINFTYLANGYMGVVSNIMDLEPSTKYVVSFKRSRNTEFYQRLHILNVSNNNEYSLNASINSGAYGNPYSYTFTTSQTGKTAIMISSNNLYPTGQTENVTEIMVRKSNTDNSYEPYTNGKASPTPDYPQEIVSCGDLITDMSDANYGKYKIPVNINDNITNIYLDAPLRKIENFTDYIDFKNSKVVRQIGETVLDGTESRWSYYTDSNKPVFYLGYVNTDWFYNKNDTWACYCNYYKGKNIVSSFDDVYNYGNNVISFRTAYPRLVIRDDSQTSLSDFKAWVQSHNLVIDYVMSTTTEETITLPNIATIDGNNTLNIETEITPSQVYIKYKSNT